VKLFPGKRAQHPIPDGAARVLAQIPDRFHDDGCSNSPDSWFGFDFSWACRIHDWRYCTRAQALAGCETSPEAKAYADKRLREDIAASLPTRWGWVKYVYWRAVARLGDGSYDSCQKEFAGGRSLSQATRGVCRHELPWPESGGAGYL
jgi:hypothetical protein